MLNLRLAICDDEAPQRLYLHGIVTKFAQTRATSVIIDVFESAEQFLLGSATEYDIILLDIQMGALNGVELAHKIRKENERTAIIFITALPDFVQEGYEVSALHYLTKPVSENKLLEVLDKAAARFSKEAQEKPSLLLPVDGAQRRIPLADILYIESLAHYVLITTVTHVHNVKMPISKLEALLDANFIHCHRSYIANIRHISKITKTDITFENGKEIPLSRRLYGTVNKAFAAHVRGTMGAFP
ncbi:MAG: LytTR family DNA-binding domain-containing protein [Defluviitaleaceae bacterium]|nr:LytTR family DNA-binding domain-containing protein [Defluviitaleaceae bacterium]MCL2275721.1 LytTR family DNA-binding domain-containing protein [Defluviitaleaceae bacterium]